jgi:hypothetical protein
MMSDSGRSVQLHGHLAKANLIPDDDSKYPILLSQQRGARIREIGPGVVPKDGRRVTRNEAAALKLVKDQTDVPVPQVCVPNPRVTRDTSQMETELIWSLAASSRVLLQERRGAWRPAHGQGAGCSSGPSLGWIRRCYQDSYLSRDLGDRSQTTANPSTARLHDALPMRHRRKPKQRRAHRRSRDAGTAHPRRRSAPRGNLNHYVHFHGDTFDVGVLPELPKSDTSAFTHADIAPRNIMVDQGRITGLIDSEDSGWFPDY